jgi:ribonuclease HI
MMNEAQPPLGGEQREQTNAKLRVLEQQQQRQLQPVLQPRPGTGVCRYFHPYPIPSAGITCYIDGSFMPETKLGGAGVVFVHDEFVKYNRGLPVPPPPKTAKQPMDAVRTELYAAVAAVHILTSEMCIPLCCVPVKLKQDSKIAIQLLDFVRVLRRSFSDEMQTWMVEENKQLAARFPWGTELTTEDLLNYADVLDTWWLLCRTAAPVEFEWVKAHLTAAPTALADGKSSISPAELDRRFNADADKLAKQGNAMNQQPDVFKTFHKLGFPLFSPISSPSPSPGTSTSLGEKTGGSKRTATTSELEDASPNAKRLKTPLASLGVECK